MFKGRKESGIIFVAGWVLIASSRLLATTGDLSLQILPALGMGALMMGAYRRWRETGDGRDLFSPLCLVIVFLLKQSQEFSSLALGAVGGIVLFVTFILSLLVGVKAPVKEKVR